MRKTGRKARREEMSPGRIEYIEAARQRLYNRRLRRTALLVALVAAVVRLQVSSSSRAAS